MDAIGPYRILGELGRGGVGVVYRAWAPELEREVAVKVLAELPAAGARHLVRFERACRAVRELGHEGIVAVHDVGATEAGPYLVTDLVAGGTLAERLRAEGALTVDGAVRLAGAMARALAAAHARGIVHGDLNPGNVLLGPRGPLLTDFGVAKVLAAETRSLTAEGTVLEAPGYTAPEQLESAGGAGVATDVFALGATLYACLIGRAPFRGATAVEVARATLSGRWDRPSALRADVGAALDAVCARCLAVTPEGRYPRVADLALDLERVLRGERPLAQHEGVADPGSSSDILEALTADPLEGSGGGRPSPDAGDDAGTARVPPTARRDPVTPTPPPDEPPAGAETTAFELPPGGLRAESGGGEKTQVLEAPPSGGPPAADPDGEETADLPAPGGPDDEDTFVEHGPAAARLWAERGRKEFAAGDLRAAVAGFDRALELDPHGPEEASVRVMRGVARRQLGNLRGALADFDRALELDPTDGKALVSRGLARAHHKDYAGAADDLGRALALLPPGDPRAPRVLAQLERAREQLGGSVIRGRRLRP